MKGINFAEANAKFGPPAGMTEEEVYTLHAYKTDKPLPIILSCWQMTDEELAEITRTRKVWLTVLGHNMAPVVIDGICPLTLPPFVNEVNNGS